MTSRAVLWSFSEKNLELNGPIQEDNELVNLTRERKGVSQLQTIPKSITATEPTSLLAQEKPIRRNYRKSHCNIVRSGKCDLVLWVRCQFAKKVSCSTDLEWSVGQWLNQTVQWHRVTYLLLQQRNVDLQMPKPKHDCMRSLPGTCWDMSLSALKDCDIVKTNILLLIVYFKKFTCYRDRCFSAS